MEEIQDWDQVKVLTVQINRLDRWWLPGLLCIGDAAHAMSPAGGVGINLAIQDAVAAANLLAEPLKTGELTNAGLCAVQRRRELPTRITQAVQVVLHRGFARVFKNPGVFKAPWQLKLALTIPGIRFAMGYAVGVGVRPEHVRIGAGQRRRRSLAAAVGTGMVAAVAISVLIFRRMRRVGNDQKSYQSARTPN